MFVLSFIIFITIYIYLNLLVSLKPKLLTIQINKNRISTKMTDKYLKLKSKVNPQKNPLVSLLKQKLKYKN